MHAHTHPHPSKIIFIMIKSKDKILKLAKVKPPHKTKPTKPIEEQRNKAARHWWHTPLILATWEAKLRRILVGGQPEQIVCKTLPTQHKKGQWSGSSGRAPA
jgi:hypothetical protein